MSAATAADMLRHRLRQRLRRLQPRRPPCIVQPQGRLAPGARAPTFVVVCGHGFDQRVPNAATTMRSGWCHGAEALGVPYRLVGIDGLADALPRLPAPVVWISGSDHAALDRPARRELARHPHAVFVDPAFDGAAAFTERHRLPRLFVDERQVARVLATAPRFVFTIAAPSGFAFYEQWRRAGVALLSLPLACDTAVDCGAPAAPAGADDVPRADVAFVGGYWRYKACQLDVYLQPYAARLSVWGHSPWPYGRYGGVLPRGSEAGLYRGALLSPVINEPHVPLMGIDINERVFKVLGAGGCALTDATLSYRDWFTDDELLVPRSAAEYRELADAVLAGEIDTQQLRSRGRAAVLARHTYRHRAAAFLAQIGAGAGAAQPANDAPAVQR